jgi:hypothetical protein
MKVFGILKNFLLFVIANGTLKKWIDLELRDEVVVSADPVLILVHVSNDKLFLNSNVRY